MYSPKFEPWSLGRFTELRPGGTTAFFRHFIDIVGPLYTRFILGVDQVEMENREYLTREFLDAYAGKSRFLIAFRHPGDNDPQVMYVALHTLMGADYRKAGLPRHPGGLFVASAEIPLWGGALATWALKNAGTIPVSHGSTSKSSMDTIVKSIIEQPGPICLAPEGQVSYFSQAEPDMDEGTAQLCLWAKGRLETRANKSGEQPAQVPEIRVLPVGVVYRFPKETWNRLNQFLLDIEAVLGMAVCTSPLLDAHGKAHGNQGTDQDWWQELRNYFRDRLARLWVTILDRGEGFYRRVYGYQKQDGLADPEARTMALAVFAMERAEAYFGKLPKGDLRERVMFLRSHSMDLSFVADPSFKDQPFMEKLLAERACGEAYWLHRHQEFADLAWYMKNEHVLGASSFDELVESAQNLADLAMRLVGGNFGKRRRFFKKTVVLRFGPSLGWKSNKDTPRRAALAEMTGALRTSFLDLLGP